MPTDSSVLRPMAMIALLAGALGSVGLTLYAGRHNNSLLLKGLFVLWVLSPFVLLMVADKVAKARPTRIQLAIYFLMLVVTVGSLLIYGTVALGAPRAKTAPMFVVVPPASWVLIAIVVGLAALISGRHHAHPPPQAQR